MFSASNDSNLTPSPTQTAPHCQRRKHRKTRLFFLGLKEMRSNQNPQKKQVPTKKYEKRKEITKACRFKAMILKTK